MANVDDRDFGKRIPTRAEIDALMARWGRIAKGDASELEPFLVDVIDVLPALVKAYKKLDDVGNAIAYLQEQGLALEAFRVDGREMTPSEYPAAVIAGALKLGWKPARSMD